MTWKCRILAALGLLSGCTQAPVHTVLPMLHDPVQLIALNDVPAHVANDWSARFAPCSGSHRDTCVVDGATLWLGGHRIHLADIAAPHVRAHALCAQEAALGERAKLRLVALLNAGPFEMASHGRRTDRYGRALRVISRQGHSLGLTLAAEGLAVPYPVATQERQQAGWCSS